jgi:hypothetical protein
MKTGLLRKLKWVKPKRPRSKRGREAVAALSDQGLAMLEAALDIGFPEPPTPMSVVNEARYLLKAAAEIEHSLLVQYLYGAYSIPKRQPASAPDQKRRGEFIQIAVEEMGHLVTIQNLLLAIGGEIYFDRESLLVGADPAGSYPFPYKLERLSLDSLAKYVTTESPPLTLLGKIDPALPPRLKPIFQQAEAVSGVTINHVGLLFMKLFWIFQPSDDPHKLWPEILAPLFPAGRHLADNHFTFETIGRHARPDEFSALNIIVQTIANREDALRALDMIAEQGEGWQLQAPEGGPRPSHFERFLEAYDAFPNELAGKIAPVPSIPTVKQITHSVAQLWARLANYRYQMLLADLSLLMLQAASDDDGGPLGRGKLIDAAIYTEMWSGVRDIAGRLITFPLIQDGTLSEVAAMPFELPSAKLPTQRDKTLAALRQLVTDSDGILQQLRGLTGADAPTDNDLSILNALQAENDRLRPALPNP